MELNNLRIITLRKFAVSVERISIRGLIEELAYIHCPKKNILEKNIY